MSGRFALTGTTAAEPETITLAAGPLVAQLVGGNLRTISWNGVEVLRAISYLVRDGDWGTYQPIIRDLRIDSEPDGFTVSYAASCEAPDGTRLALRAKIEGEATGKLVFDVTAQPDGDFATNRCGFCVLHPIVGVAGGPVTVEHTDGRVIHTVFPDLIEPWQPFKQMRAITHPVAPGVSAECRMEGDAWEMEDQRNWTDASFKTYVRPLELPWPYSLSAGEPVSQSVRLTIAGRIEVSGGGREPGDTIRVRLGTDGPAMPAIGVVVYPEDSVDTLRGIERLRELRPQCLLFHFDPTAGHSQEALRGFAALADAYPAETTLECVVAAAGGSDADLYMELAHTASLVRQAGLRLDAVAVSPSVDRQSTPPGSRWPDCRTLEAVHAAARAAFPAQKLGGGMFSYFTELNRKRVGAETLDFITHCTCPIVHAADDLSVMQTLEALPFVARSVRAIYDETPYHIGPSTIAMRQNPYGSATKENPDGQRVPMAACDPRHNALFAAAWAAGYAARVAPFGLEQLTLSGFTGPFGLLAGNDEPAPDGHPRPLFHVVKALAAMSGLPVLSMDDDDRVSVLAVRSKQGGLRLCCANLTPGELTLDFSDVPGAEAATAFVLDERAIGLVKPFESPLQSLTLLLCPYGVATIATG